MLIRLLALVVLLGAGACVPGASGDACSDTVPCPDGQRCDGNTGVCLKPADGGAAEEELPTDDGSIEEPETDGGGPVLDGGSPVMDGGEPAIDGDEPVIDGGEPVIDGGNPVIDGGNPVIDGGNPVIDAGDPAVDAGDPVIDAGDPGTDAGPTYPYDGRATYYTGIEHGSCGFGTALWPHIVAPAEWMNGDARLCGAFLEITSRYAQHPGDAANCSKGTTVTVMVSDVCPAAGNEEWCADPNVAHLDLSADAFATLADPNCGVVDGLEWRFVERPDDAALRIVNKDGVNAWWYAFFVHQHRYALTKAEVKDSSANATWVNAGRTTYNAFLVESDAGLTLPLSLRLTDVHGQVVVLDDVVTSFISDAAFDSSRQFPAGLGGGDPL